MGNRKSSEAPDERRNAGHNDEPNRKCGCFDLKLRRQTNSLWTRK